MMGDPLTEPPDAPLRQRIALAQLVVQHAGQVHYEQRDQIIKSDEPKEFEIQLKGSWFTHPISSRILTAHPARPAR